MCEKVCGKWPLTHELPLFCGRFATSLPRYQVITFRFSNLVVKKPFPLSPDFFYFSSVSFTIRFCVEGKVLS